MHSKIQILIVDDHPIVVSGCRSILSSEDDISVIAAKDAPTALEMFRAARPDIAIVDLNLPGSISGFELMNQILTEDPAARIIVFTMAYDPIHAARAIEGGAKGYVGKSDHPEQLLNAVRTVMAGQPFLDPDMAQKLAFFDRGRLAKRLSDLTPRERDILRLLHQGKTMVEIAAAIQTSYKTVANTCAMLKRELGARSLTDLARIVLEGGSLL